MPHIAVKLNRLIDVDVEPESEYRRAKVILCHVKLQIWSRELTTSTLWPSSALSGCGQYLTPKNLGGHVALTVLELLTFNAQKFSGSRDPGHAPFSETF